MGYQFAHVYTYSVNGGKKGNYKISGCLGEAFREKGYTAHIERTAEPHLLHGNRTDVETAVKNYQENFKDARGHKLRKDGKTLLAGVFSWPPGTTKDQFVTGNNTLINYLKTEYGTALRCVLTHVDEPFLRGDHKGETHFHTHFMVVPEPSQNMKELHPGLKAKADARADGKNVFEQDQAYKWAMGDWQDKINREVGAPLGLLRLGPQEKRLSRREQKILDDAQKTANQIEVQAVKKAEDQAISIYQTAERTQTAAEKKEAEIQKREKAVKEREINFNAILDSKITWANIEPPKLLESGKSFYERSKMAFAAIIHWVQENTKKHMEKEKEYEQRVKKLAQKEGEVKIKERRIDIIIERLEGKQGKVEQTRELERQKFLRPSKEPEPKRGVKR